MLFWIKDSGFGIAKVAKRLFKNEVLIDSLHEIWNANRSGQKLLFEGLDFEHLILFMG